MKVYYVGTDDWDYDEYDAFAVVAENEDRALEIAKKFFHKHQWDGIYIEEEDLTEEHIILESFNAG